MAKKSPGAVLKAKGLIPSEWNLRKLSRGQKSWVTKQAKTFSEVVKKPKEFITLPTRGGKQKQQAIAAGMRVTNGRAVIHAPTGGRARRVGDKIVVKSSEVEKEYFFATPGNFLEMLAECRTREPLKRNQTWGMSIDGNQLNKQFKSIDALEFYSWHMDLESEENQTMIAIILITDREGSWFKRKGK